MPVFKATMKSMKAYVGTFVIYLMVFMLFGPIQANGISKSQDTMFQDEGIQLTVVDQDQSEISKGLIHYLKAEDQVTILHKANKKALENLNDDILFDRQQYALIIPKGFGSNVEEGKVTDSMEYIQTNRSASGYLMNQKINTYLEHIMVYLTGGYDLSSAIQNTESDMKEARESQVSIKNAENARSRSRVIFTFNAYSLLMILTVFTGSILNQFKNPDLANRIRVGGLSFHKRYGGMISALLVMSLTVTTFVIGFTALDARLHGESFLVKLPYYALNSYVLMLVALGIGYFLSSFSKDENTVNMVANMINLTMCFLCGIFVDQSLLTAGVLQAAHFMPLFWYAEAIKQVACNSADAILGSGYPMSILIQILFAVAFFAAGLIISRKRETYNV